MCIPRLGNFLSLFSFPSDFPEAWEILKAEISNCGHKMDQKQEHYAGRCLWPQRTLRLISIPTPAMNLPGLISVMEAKGLQMETEE